jgi:hypothetical protein
MATPSACQHEHAERTHDDSFGDAARNRQTVAIPSTNSDTAKLPASLKKSTESASRETELARRLLPGSTPNMMRN